MASNRIVDLQQDQANTIICEFTMMDSTGTQIDATGITFTFTGKSDADDADSEASWQTTVVGNGYESIDLSASTAGLDVGTYRYDIVAEEGTQRETYENLSLILNETVKD